MIIGELISTRRPQVFEAAKNGDGDLIRQLAKQQVEAGAHYLEVNSSSFGDREREIMKWFVGLIQDTVDVPLCIGSVHPEVLDTGLSLCHYGKPIVNAISCEEKRFNEVLPLVLKYKAMVLGLLMDDVCTADTAEQRYTLAGQLINRLKENGVAPQDIYLDLLLKPICLNANAGQEVLRTILMIKKDFPEVNFACNMSDISFGLPNRNRINRIFMIQLMTVGVQTFFLNPLDKGVQADLLISRMLLGHDPYCCDFLNGYLKGLCSMADK
ncbi:dihydropteroate synthase [Candidatus Formimonas warabiya]|uniref:Pterin-binding domain-containing protein n=1 Tax=Formimonas warabiya TaxID=1761012 RepID=A0A3G1KRB9_FORW1|nr:dihydropteroate synthase [Candidatus Formimonas warabiya]ATW24987.1 hypothetical protein DCMF_09555 [Candidatus Formimonas warabiya]